MARIAYRDFDDQGELEMKLKAQTKGLGFMEAVILLVANPKLSMRRRFWCPDDCLTITEDDHVLRDSTLSGWVADVRDIFPEDWMVEYWSDDDDDIS